MQPGRKVKPFLDNDLILQTTTTYDTPKENAYFKHCGKSRKCWLAAFSPFPTMFSAQWKTNLVFLVTFRLSSANIFDLDKAKILLFDEALGKSREIHKKKKYLTGSSFYTFFIYICIKDCILFH